jgi:predicted nucleic-acid-binding Zn-ribbon protein
MTKYITVCPKCGSTNISAQGVYTPSDYCKDCGYGKAHLSSVSNIIFPEIDIEEIENFKKEIKKNNE